MKQKLPQSGLESSLHSVVSLQRPAEWMLKCRCCSRSPMP